MPDRTRRSFRPNIRPINALRDLLASDPYRAFRLAPSAKRVVTFLRRRPTSRLALPIEFEGARILAVKGAEAFSAYVRHPKSPRSEEHTSELQSRVDLVCRLLLEKK